MIGRLLMVAACAAAAWAQLPPPQAAPPPPDDVKAAKKRMEEQRSESRLDAVVYDLQGKPVADLKAEDFSLTVSGKPQKIRSASYLTAQPLRVVVVLDDLGLSRENSDAARAALRHFVDQLAPGDEMAILRASSGSGVRDHLTADKQALRTAIDDAPFNPAAEGAPVETVAGALRTVVRGVIAGFREMPGRKAVLFVSERIRNAATAMVHFGAAPNLAGAVLYAIDMSAKPEMTQLDLGLPQMTRDSGGFYIDGNNIADALARVARDQRGYYALTYEAEDVAYDFLVAAPRIEQLQLAVARRDMSVRFRNGLFGPPAGEDSDPLELDPNLNRLVGTELVGRTLGTRVSPLAVMDRSWRMNAVVHIDGANVTFIRGVDGKYHGSLDVVVALSSDSGASAEERSARTVDVAVSEQALGAARSYGIDYSASLPIPKPGAYQALVAARDAGSGRSGTARAALFADWAPNQLSMSSLALHGEYVAVAAGKEDLREPNESFAVRTFRPGHKIEYSYDLFNVGADAEKRSSVEVRTRIWREGALVMDGASIPIRFEPSETPSHRAASGTLTLTPQTKPARYILGVTVRDKISGHSTTRYIDFEVRS